MSKHKMKDPRKVFDAAWDDLAEQGKCDTKGGQEYARVITLWKEMDEPADVVHFISENCNLPAEKQTVSDAVSSPRGAEVTQSQKQEMAKAVFGALERTMEALKLIKHHPGLVAEIASCQRTIKDAVSQLYYE